MWILADGDLDWRARSVYGLNKPTQLKIASILGESVNLRHQNPNPKIQTKKRKLKGTLMEIWKFHCMFGLIWKQYPEHLAFLILIFLELLTRKVCIFLKK